MQLMMNEQSQPASQKIASFVLPNRDDDPKVRVLSNGTNGRAVMDWITNCATPLDKLIIAIHCAETLTDDQLAFLYEELPWHGRPSANEELCRLIECTKDNPRSYDTSDK